MNAVEKSFAQNVNLELTIPATLTVNEIVDMVSLATEDEGLFIMIAAIDEAVDDWSFTNRCFEHFRTLMKQYEDNLEGEGE